MSDDRNQPVGNAPRPDNSAGLRRDLRRYASQTNVRLFAGMLILFMVVGNGLVFLIYGSGAVRTSLLCMLTFSVPVILIALLLALVEWISRRGRGG